MTWRSSFNSISDLFNNRRILNRPPISNNGTPDEKKALILFIIAFFLLLPLFFQLLNGVFDDTSYYFNSGGNLGSLPIPLSTITCGVGMVILGGLTKTRLTMATILLTCGGMLTTSLLFGIAYGSIEKSKVVLFVQYILPMCALVLGQQYGARTSAVNIMAKAFTLALLLTVPAQLLSTWAHGSYILSPSLFLFSAYQHLQYIPVIFVGAFFVAIFTLWELHGFRLPLSILAGLMGVYTSLSHSMLAIVFLTLGLVCFSVRAIILRKKPLHAMVITSITVFILISSAFSTNTELLKEKLGEHFQSTASPEIYDAPSKVDDVKINISSSTSVETNGSTSAVDETAANTLSNISLEANDATTKTDEEAFEPPRNLAERAVYLKFYIDKITHSSGSIFLGHREPPDRSSYPSAHNYYLDFTYNFGLLAAIPLLALAGLTVHLVIRNLPKIFISSETVGVTGVVLFLLFADNLFKVGMRQPYPGIITFFLWGVLLALLLRLEKRRQ